MKYVCACSLVYSLVSLQILVLAVVRRAITHKHCEDCVSIPALFYLDFLSVANIICVHAFLLAVNCASPQSVFAKFSQGLLFPVSRVSLLGGNAQVA